jgi:peptide/nickel transport system substrate-binding protein
MAIASRLLVLAAALAFSAAPPLTELRFCLRADPKTFDPLLAREESSETVRYLTAGVLIRFNRRTQQLDPELASSWKVGDQGRRIDFVLRRGIRFSDGTPFGPADVVAAIRRLTEPGLTSAIADSFRSGAAAVHAQATGQDRVSITFSAPVGGIELRFDQLPITSAGDPQARKSVLGPYAVAEYKPGNYVLLHRNPNYWKLDDAGRRLPRLNTIRLDIQSNRETELLRFRRGELHFVDRLEPESFARLRRDLPSSALNAGPSLDSEFLWFNQVPNAPIPPHTRRWFQSKSFRRAISAAINRNDIIRLVYRGYAHAAAGPVSQANRMWVNASLQPPGYDVASALKLLAQDGFRLEGGTLRDRAGNAVEFSVVTNAGSRTRTQMGALLQQDLAKIGIRVNFTPLEFQSLIERITSSNQYEACLLGFANVEVDPNAQSNVWLSSGSHHAWNPGQSTPATPWEAEIDRLVREQAATADPKSRKKAFDRVQEVLAEYAPIIYLVNPDVLVALSPALRNAAPSAHPPHVFWNVEHLYLAAPADRRSN